MSDTPQSHAAQRAALAEAKLAAIQPLIQNLPDRLQARFRNAMDFAEVEVAERVAEERE